MIRKFYMLAAFWLLTLLAAKAQQNLVVNESFEEHWYCPPAKPQDSFPCMGWRSPNLGTLDYFNACSMDTSTGVPNNSHGHYFPHRGNAYIGLLLISIETAAIEHIQSQLTEPLKTMQKYKISFWVRLAYQYSDYTAYNIGMYFSKTKNILGDDLLSKDSYIEGMTHELQAQVFNEKGNFITDTTWTEISGIYTALGGEKYITIGMFWDDTPIVVKAWKKAKENQSLGNTKRFGKSVKKYLLKKNPYMEKKYEDAPGKIGQHFPYYLIDDVKVILLED